MWTMGFPCNLSKNHLLHVTFHRTVYFRTTASRLFQTGTLPIVVLIGVGASLCLQCGELFQLGGWLVVPDISTIPVLLRSR
jgi:hypothetical protein